MNRDFGVSSRDGLLLIRVLLDPCESIPGEFLIAGAVMVIVSQS